MANPGELNEIWASDPSAVIDTPPDALESVGWSAGQPPTAAHVNYLFNKSSSWWAYLKAALDDASSVFYFKAASTFTSLRLHMVGGVNAWLEIDKATGEFNFQHASGATNCLKVTADGLKGATAVASASTGIRYGYPSGNKQNQLFAVGPDLGGYTASTASIGATRPEIFDPGGTGYVGVCNSGSGGAVDCKLRRPLTIPEITGQLSGYPVLVEAAAAFTGAADDLEVRICRKELATGTITVLTTLKSSDASNTIAHTCLPASNMYFVEVVGIGVAGAGVTTDRVRNVILSVDMQAVNAGI